MAEDKAKDDGTVPAVDPEPLPVGSGPYDPPEGASTESGSEPAVFPEPLPVGSGPYEPPPGAEEISEGKVPEEVGEAPTTEAKEAPDTHGPPEDEEPEAKAAPMTKKSTKTK